MNDLPPFDAGTLKKVPRRHLAAMLPMLQEGARQFVESIILARPFNAGRKRKWTAEKAVRLVDKIEGRRPERITGTLPGLNVACRWLANNDPEYEGETWQNLARRYRAYRRAPE